MWDFFSGLWSAGLNWVRQTAEAIAGSFMTGLRGLGQFLADTLGVFFNRLTAYLSNLFGPLVDFIGGLVYFLTSTLELVGLLVAILLYLVQVVAAIGGGLIRSMVSLATFEASQLTPMHNPYAAGTSLFMQWFNAAGGGVLAQVFSWGVWLLAGYAILGLFAGGGKQSGE